MQPAIEIKEKMLQLLDYELSRGQIISMKQAVGQVNLTLFDLFLPMNSIKDTIQFALVYFHSTLYGFHNHIELVI